MSYISNGRIVSIKYAEILPSLYILILKLLDWYGIFYVRNVRTKLYFKVVLKYVALKLIYQSLDNKFKSIKGIPKRSLVRIPPDAGILDSIVDFILTIFFEFSIKSYRYCEIFSVMENLVCERTSFGGVYVGALCFTILEIQK